jgi:hypothetical protein
VLAAKGGATLLAEVGRDVADMGSAVARAIEPQAMPRCIPGFRENSWMHAFKLLRCIGSASAQKKPGTTASRRRFA